MLIIPEFLWSGGRLHRGLALETDGVRVTRLRQATGDTADLRPFLLLPMLTDLQVNGGGGVMLNSDPSPDGLRAIAAAHRRLGIGAIMPTLITDTHAVMEAAAAAALAVRSEPGQLGIHFEGPHIAISRRGTHHPDLIRPLDLRTVTLVERLRSAGVAVMVTLAPELAEAALLERLVASGAIVSAGHSAANSAQAHAAFSAGVGCVTHLFNAMEPMLSRAPGLLGAALATDVMAGIICDGIHVAWEMVGIALRARLRPGLTFAVSDAMATVGGPSSFTLYGHRITLCDGRLVNADGALAGAHLDLATALANLVNHVNLPLAAAIAMCTDTPRRLLGLPPQHIRAGNALDSLLALDHDLARLSQWP